MNLNESIVEDAMRMVKSEISEPVSYFIFHPSLFFPSHPRHPARHAAAEAAERGVGNKLSKRHNLIYG